MAERDDEKQAAHNTMQGSCILIDVSLPEGKTFSQPPMRHPLTRPRVRRLKGVLVRKKRRAAKPDPTSEQG